MTDNRTTKLRKLLDERRVKWWPLHNTGYYEDRDTEFVVNGKKHTAHEWGDGLDVYNLTPEQAVAATLGSVPDEIELTQSYDAGFRNGVMAVYQQLEGIEDYEELQCFIAEYWGEGEGYDER